VVFRRLKPIKPTRTEPNNKNVEGTVTAAGDAMKLWVLPEASENCPTICPLLFMPVTIVPPVIALELPM
jgi:hypothetical protein